MQNIAQLKKARKQAFMKYQVAKTALETPSEDIAAIAQKANEAWREYKKIDLDLTNSLTLKKMGELYGI